MEIRHRIMGRVLAGDLEDAEQLAHIWTREASEDVMSWLVLAEVHCAKKDFEKSLEALQRARAIDDWHPMYFRAVCLAAHAVGQHTVASVALVLGVLAGLPDAIVDSLDRLLGDEKDDEDVDPEPQWLALVEEEDEEEDWMFAPVEQTPSSPPKPPVRCVPIEWHFPKGARISGGSDFGNEWPMVPAPEEDCDA